LEEPAQGRCGEGVESEFSAYLWCDAAARPWPADFHCDKGRLLDQDANARPAVHAAKPFHLPISFDCGCEAEPWSSAISFEKQSAVLLSLLLLTGPRQSG